MASSVDAPLLSNGTAVTANTADSPVNSSKWKQFTHPTNSLLFMDHLDTKNNHEQKPPLQAAVKLKVIVVGGGLGGLACAIALARRGHVVTVLEAATQLGEIGAGIQVPSNSSRLLLSWGLEPFLSPHVVEPNHMSFRRWDNGKIIGHTKLIPDFRENFKAPYYVVHRAHFHDALHKRALELGIEVRVASRVTNYNLDKPSVSLEDGHELHADLIVAADGVKSGARKLVLGGIDDPPRPTGFAAYRATVDVEKMKADPEVSWLLEQPALNIWIGEDRHVMTYTISAGKSFNMVLSHVDRSDPSTWKPETAKEDMRAYFSGWDPCLTKVINMIEHTIKWPLMCGTPLSNWVAPSSRALIIGDAAHAMVPYMSQGAAMAVEDGAALAAILSLIRSPQQLSEALQVFQTERLKRSGQMQCASLLNGKIWHFADGPEQRARDAGMKAETEGRSFSWSANQWSDPVTQFWAYNYDAEVEIENAWNVRSSEQYKA